MVVLGYCHRYFGPAVGFTHCKRVVFGSTVVYMNSLGDILMRRYTIDFISNMQNISGIFTGPTPAKYVQIKTKSGHGMKTKTLFKDGKFNRWSIRQITKLPSGSVIRFDWNSVISHRCQPLLSGVRHMTLGSQQKEECYYCHVNMPQDIVGLWKLQNYDMFSEMMGDMT